VPLEMSDVVHEVTASGTACRSTSCILFGESEDGGNHKTIYLFYTHYGVLEFKLSPNFYLLFLLVCYYHLL
jgi:hypothetical protein